MSLSSASYSLSFGQKKKKKIFTLNASEDLYHLNVMFCIESARDTVRPLKES